MKDGSVIPEQPITVRRPAEEVDTKLVPQTGHPRAGVAATQHAPNGTENYREKHGFRKLTVLQQHVKYWDPENTGMITVRNTFQGFRDLGFNLLICTLAVIMINGTMSYPTWLPHTFIPDPWFRVRVDTIHASKHGSDTGAFDNEGRFIPQRFEDMFSKHPGKNDRDLTLRGMYSMVHGQRVGYDPYGWTGAIFEWGVSTMLLYDHGVIRKDDARKLFDGSIFYEIRDARKSGRGWHKGVNLTLGLQLITQALMRHYGIGSKQ